VTVEALMTQAVTVLTPSDETQDSIGEVVSDEPTELETVMYLEPVSGREELMDRDTPIADWIGFGKASVTFRSDCRIVYGSHVLQVIGDPRPKWNPTLSAVSHIEMDLQEIDDSTPFEEHVDAVAHPVAVGGMGGA
jgi:hypothetical protein